MRLSLLFFVLFLMTIPQTARADNAWQLTTDWGEHPTWSPDGSQIAFVSSRIGSGGIWVIPASGGKAEQIIYGGVAPAWSPDGSQIAFQLWRNGNWDIWVIPATGGEAKQVTIDGGADPAWSPDGSQIAFTSWRNGAPDIWAIPANGGVARQVTTCFGWDPAWSPDGSLIAFARRPHPRIIFERIWVVPASGGVWPEDLVQGFNPAWSPDGNWIAFAVGGLSPSLIKVMRSTGPPALWLTDGDGGDAEPAWSPDGSQVAFSSSRSGWPNVWVIDVGAVTVEPTTWGAIKASFK